MFTRLAELSVHGANVQEGQIVLVAAEIGLEEQARATAEAAYKRGAKFVVVAYFDPYVKRVRIESADPDTLGFVPQWYGERVREHGEQNGARISLRSVTAPNLMDGLDKSLLGEDTLPSVKETLKVIGERSTNWCYVPAPHPAWAALVHPDLPADEAYQQLWRELEHVLRLDEPDPLAAWDERMAVLNDYRISSLPSRARTSNAGCGDAAGPLTMLPSSRNVLPWQGQVSVSSAFSSPSCREQPR